MKRLSLKKIAVALVFIVPLLVVLLQKDPLRAASDVQIVYKTLGPASNYKIGSTYQGQGGEDYTGSSSYVDKTSAVAMNVLDVQNRHASSGFGMPNLWIDGANRNIDSWLWDNLDRSVESMVNAKNVGSSSDASGADTMITLGMAPPWMTTHQSKTNPSYPAYSDWTNYSGASPSDPNSKYTANPARNDNSITGETIEASVDPWFEDDFAYMSAKIAERYPDVTNFQVWNEMKGYYKASENRWDYEQYTSLYNKVYASVKTVRPNAKIGGPYVVMGSWADSAQASHPTNIEACKGSWGVFDQRDIDVVSYWLEHKTGGDFINVSVDTRANAKHGVTQEANYDEFNVKAKIATLKTCIDYLKNQSPNQSDRVLSVRIAEFYPYPNTKDGLTTQHGNAIMANALGETISSRFDMVLLWDTMSEGCDFAPSGGLSSPVLLTLMSSTRCGNASQAGVASPLALTTAGIKQRFGAGTNLFSPTFDEAKLGVFASTKGIMLVNKRNTTEPISINGCLDSLGAYQVKFTDLLDCNKPTAPSTLTAQLNNRDVILNWGEGSDVENLIKHYNVYRKVGSNAAVKIQTLDANARTFTDSYGGSEDIAYTYYVTAVDSFDNESTISTQADVSIVVDRVDNSDTDDNDDDNNTNTNNTINSSGTNENVSLNNAPKIASPKTGLDLDSLKFIVPAVLIIVIGVGIVVRKKRSAGSVK